MCTDVIESCECPTMRLWLGFEANPLMLPPQYAGAGPGPAPGKTPSILSPIHHHEGSHHNPSASYSTALSSSHHPFDAKSIWEKDHLEHFAVWLSKRTAWITKLEKAQRVEMKRRRGELIKGAADQRAELMSAKSPTSVGGGGLSTGVSSPGGSPKGVNFSGGLTTGGSGTSAGRDQGGDDESKDKPKEKRLSLNMILKMKHMSRAIQQAISQRVEEEKVDALHQQPRRNPSIDVKVMQDGVIATQPQPPPQPKKDRSPTSLDFFAVVVEKMNVVGDSGGEEGGVSGKGKGEGEGGVSGKGGSEGNGSAQATSLNIVPNTVQFSGAGILPGVGGDATGGVGSKDKKQGLSLDQRIHTSDDVGGGGGGGGSNPGFSSSISAAAAAAAATVSSLMSQTSGPFVLAPPGTD